jgi:hypothetical protein
LAIRRRRNMLAPLERKPADAVADELVDDTSERKLP